MIHIWVILTVDNDGLFADMWLGCVIIGRNSAVETRRQLEGALCEKFIQELLHFLIISSSCFFFWHISENFHIGDFVVKNCIHNRRSISIWDMGAGSKVTFRF